VRKPWCGECAKCAYVWLQFAAHLPRAIVDETFEHDLGEHAGNERYFRDLLGLGAHTPFECVGSVPEARVALAVARERGVLGPRMLALADQIGAVDIAELACPLVELGTTHGMPDRVASVVMPQLAAAARAAADRLGVTVRGSDRASPSSSR
jgi:hypothetical protein